MIIVSYFCPFSIKAHSGYSLQAPPAKMLWMSSQTICFYGKARKILPGLSHEPRREKTCFLHMRKTKAQLIGADLLRGNLFFLLHR